MSQSSLANIFLFNGMLCCGTSDQKHKLSGGIGINFRTDHSGNLSIDSMAKNGPADRSRMLRCGDVLTHVDEQFVVGAPSNLVVPRLLGPCGTEVKLTFNRLVQESSAPKFATFSVVLVRDKLERVRMYPDDIFGLSPGNGSFRRVISQPMKYEVIDVSPSPRRLQEAREPPFFLAKPDVRSSFTKEKDSSSTRNSTSIPSSSLSRDVSAPSVATPPSAQRQATDIGVSKEATSSYVSPKPTRTVEERPRTNRFVAEKDGAKKETSVRERNRFDINERISPTVQARKETKFNGFRRDVSPDPPRNLSRVTEDAKKTEASNTLSTAERMAASERLRSLLKKEELKASAIKLPAPPGEGDGAFRRLSISKAV